MQGLLLKEVMQQQLQNQMGTRLKASEGVGHGDEMVRQDQELAQILQDPSHPNHAALKQMVDEEGEDLSDSLGEDEDDLQQLAEEDMDELEGEDELGEQDLDLIDLVQDQEGGNGNAVEKNVVQVTGEQKSKNVELEKVNDKQEKETSNNGAGLEKLEPPSKRQRLDSKADAETKAEDEPNTSKAEDTN